MYAKTKTLPKLAALLALAAFCTFTASAADLLADGGKKPDAPAARARVEVVFVIDTTGSMSGLIAGAQQKIWSIVNGIVSGKPVPEVKVGLVAFRDKKEEYVTQVTNLTANLDEIHQKLFALSAKGGGDTPESVNQGLDDAVSRITWSAKGEKVYRVIFLVGDAPPHMDYTDDTKYPELCKAAVLKDIVINTVRCGGNAETETTWKEIAAKAEGSYTSIAQSGGVQVVATPYDKEMAELSGKLVGTGVYYGDAKRREMARGAARKAEAEAKEAAEGADGAKLAVAADKSEFRAKTSAAAPAAAGPSGAPPAEMAGMGMGGDVGKADLVAAFEAGGGEALKKAKDEELPEEMQKMSEEERKAFLEKKAAERKEIQAKIEGLGKKRAEFIKDELSKKGSGDKSFDGEVMKMLKAQAGEKGIEYNESK